MEKRIKKHRQRLRIVLFSILALVLIGTFVGYMYFQDYYHAHPDADVIAMQMREEDGNLYFDGTSTRGFIIYPGGKVDERAYAPFAAKLHAAGGDTVVIAKMPGRLAIMDASRALSIIQANLQVSSWYIVGHSLGGTAASIMVSEKPDAFDGIVFLGSYAYKDLSAFQGAVLLMRGSEDLIVNIQKLEEAEALLPEHATHILLEGANHAGFGSYGPQEGDGVAALSDDEIQNETVSAILQYIQ